MSTQPLSQGIGVVIPPISRDFSIPDRKDKKKRKVVKQTAGFSKKRRTKSKVGAKTTQTTKTPSARAEVCENEERNNPQETIPAQNLPTEENLLATTEALAMNSASAEPIAEASPAQSNCESTNNSGEGFSITAATSVIESQPAADEIAYSMTTAEVEPAESLEPVPPTPATNTAVFATSYKPVVSALCRFWTWVQQKFSVQQARKRLRVCETVSLGEKRFLAVIQVDGQEFLVGGSSTSVSTLAQLEPNRKFSDALRRTCEQELSHA